MEEDKSHTVSFTISLEELKSRKFYNMILLAKKRRQRMIKDLEGEVKRLSRLLDDLDDIED